jgi:hypothetical protein
VSAIPTSKEGRFLPAKFFIDFSFEPDTQRKLMSSRVKYFVPTCNTISCPLSCRLQGVSVYFFLSVFLLVFFITFLCNSLLLRRISLHLSFWLLIKFCYTISFSTCSHFSYITFSFLSQYFLWSCVLILIYSFPVSFLILLTNISLCSFMFSPIHYVMFLPQLFPYPIKFFLSVHDFYSMKAKRKIRVHTSIQGTRI